MVKILAHWRRVNLNVKQPEAGDNALGELKALAYSIKSSLRKTTIEKIKVGEWLLQARQLLASDNAFGDWCKENFPGLNRHTRQNYMNISKVFGGELFNTIDLLSDTALYLLARPNTPEIIQKYFIKKAGTVKVIKVKDIQAAKTKYSDVEQNDKELFETLKARDFSQFDLTALDFKRGGSQAERINKAQNGYCVVAYPFDAELISWAAEHNCLLPAPNQNTQYGSDKPFYNFWLYRNNEPSKRMIFDNFWRDSKPPQSALTTYKQAINEDGSDLKAYAKKLKGYVLHSNKVDAFWHAPVLAELVNDQNNNSKKASSSGEASFWLTSEYHKPNFSVEELAECFRADLEERGDEEEIRCFLKVQKAMSLAAPMLKAYIY